MLSTTEKAAERLKNVLLQRYLKVGMGFRLTRSNNEPGGTIFNIQLDSERENDEVFVSYGIKVIMDQDIAALVGESELDYIDEPVGGFSLKGLGKSI
jgi:Fe-S cluster assembly iron-binding protein IscA